MKIALHIIRKRLQLLLSPGVWRWTSFLGLVVYLTLNAHQAMAACAAPPPGDIPYTALGVACGPAQLDSSTAVSAIPVITTGSTAVRALGARTGDRLNILDYMPAGATQPVNQAVEAQVYVTTTVGGTTLTTVSKVFTAAAVGNQIFVPGAGPSGGLLSTTITGYTDQKTVTLATAASTALANATEIILFGPDATATMTAAINAANAKMLAGNMACIYLPSGQYMISGAIPVFNFNLPGCVIGEGPSKSFINLAPTFSGDLFAWSEAWSIPGRTPGARVADLRINGWFGAPAQQNALMFYDRNDYVSLENIDIFNMPGRALASGFIKQNTTNLEAYLRESDIRGVRFFNDGLPPQGGVVGVGPRPCGAATTPATTPGVPVVEFYAQSGSAGTADSTNTIKVSQMDIYGSQGPSLVIRAFNGHMRGLHFSQLRIEGTEDAGATNSAGDLIQIGDPSLAGNVNGVTFTDSVLADPYVGCAAIRTTASSAALAPYEIAFDGLIGGGLPNGQGVRIDAGRLMKFVVPAMYTTDKNVVVGMAVGSVTVPASSNMVAGPIIVDGYGTESNWTYAVAPADVASLLAAVLRTGIPSATGPSGGAVNVAGTVGANAVKSSVVTVSTLPTCNSGTEGTRLAVSDAVAPAFNVALVGGGTVHVGARCNGTAWVAE